MFATLRLRPPPAPIAGTCRLLHVTPVTPKPISTRITTSKPAPSTTHPRVPPLLQRSYHHQPPEHLPPPPLQTHRPPPRDPRNPYGYTTYNNDHYVRLQAAKPLPTPSGLSITGVIAIAAGSALIFYFSNLETVPVSGRTRFNVYSRESVLKISEMEHKRMLESLKEQGARILGDWDPRTMLVKRVMRRLIPYSGLQEEDWEVYVIDDAHQANACVLPGGKVFVFTGILSLARNESAIAAVLGHEIAHNLAEHVGERLSAEISTNIVMFSLLMLGGVVGIGPLVWWLAGSMFNDIAFGYPMSRMQESEADYIGLMMMSEACYDPEEAARFWARMEMAGAGNGMVPEWGSTHPSNVNRIKKIREWLPEALEKREKSDCSATGIRSFAEAFREALRRGQIVVVPA
ncbi:peptidase family M48-domain-containing protein [Cladorrhinum sp. PSN259]|nr:peptidase family M48-domain-containing protein [Cladorrhinum sp. PSN259]